LSGNSGYSTGPHLHLEVVKGKVTVPGTGTAISLTAAAKVLGSTSLSNGSTTTPGVDTAAGQEQINSLLGSASSSSSLLSKFYSGDKSSILASVGAMASSVGINNFQQQLNAANGSYLSGPGTPGGTVSTPGGGGNNVSITVQVPDVTAADAVKFAQLVKQYLDNDSLISNTGSF
jgi:hypothetical protein